MPTASDSFTLALAPLQPDTGATCVPDFMARHGLSPRSLAWGMWRLSGSTADARRLVETALDNDVRLLDTADIYGDEFGEAERILGKVLSQAPELRQRMVLATKGGIIPGTPYCASADYLVAACEASLKRLGVGQIDLYQIHRPDHLTHPHEVAEAFSRLRAAGKITDIGVSNYTPPQIRALVRYLDAPLASVQPEFSALAIDPVSDGGLDLAMELDLTVLAWSPLGRGALASGTGLPRSAEVCAALDLIAGREGVSRTTVAYAWIMAHPAAPLPIIGSQREARIVEALEARRVDLTRADWYGILTAARGQPLP